MMKDDRYYLELAFAEAEIAASEGSVPIGAVIVGPDGEIVSTGHNKIYITWDTTAHAEVEAIRNAGKKLFDPHYKNRCTIYSTVEPCPMCSGALMLADMSRSVWALTDHYLGAMCELKEIQKFKHKYDKIKITPQPFEDLALRSELLHRTYTLGQGKEYKVSAVNKTI
jgi:tRNA(adenine34) deaminase